MAGRTVYRSTEEHSDGRITRRTSDELVPRSIASLDETLPPTPTARLLEAGGVSVYVLSKDPELVAAFTIAGGERVAVHVIWSFRELRRHVAGGECKIVLLDADLFEGDLRAWIEELRALEPALITLVAAPRPAAEGVMELLSERLVSRMLIKPAAIGITRVLIEAVVSRYMQLQDELTAQSVLEARDAEDAARTAVPAPAGPGVLALKPAPADPLVIRAPRRRPVAASRTSWPAWFLAVVLVGTLVGGAFVDHFSSLGLRELSDDATPPASGFAAPVEVEATSAGDVAGEAEAAFVSPPTALSPPPPVSALEPPVSALEATDPALEPTDSGLEATAPPELEDLLGTAWTRVRENQLLDPPGDSAHDYLARAEALAPNHPDVAAMRSVLGEALAESAHLALQSRDFERAEMLAAEAFRLGASGQTLAELDLDLAAAREVALRSAPAEPPAAGASPANDGRLSADLEAARIQGEYLATPALPGELRLLTSVEAVYPESALRAGVAGWVDVEFVVGTDGIPDEARVVATEPPGVFEYAALDAISLYRYQPFERDGRVYERRLRVRVRFDLTR